MLARSGPVRSVSVLAWPAVELLWHHADSVTVSMRSWSGSGGASGRLDGELAQLGDVGTLHATVGVAHVGALVVHHALLVSAGGRIMGEGTVREADLRAAVPFLRSVVPVTSAGGRLVLRGTASVLGLFGGWSTRPSGPGRGLVVDVAGLATVTAFLARAVLFSAVSAQACGAASPPPTSPTSTDLAPAPRCPAGPDVPPGRVSRPAGLPPEARCPARPAGPPEPSKPPLHSNFDWT